MEQLPEFRKTKLLEFDRSASLFELLLELFSFCLRNVLFDSSRSAIDESLCFLQAEARSFKQR